MITKRFTLALMGVAFIGLSACSSAPVMETLKKDGQYWQRADASEATYQEGPKTQQMLHRDISRCVTELREEDRLTGMRYTLPADNKKDGTPPDPSTAEGDMAQWGTPERDGYLLAEMSDYHDFETCMMAKGWERMEHVPYNIADKSRRNYIETLTGKPYGTETAREVHGDSLESGIDDSMYGHLNR
jgi:hypothetical protein